MRQPSGACFTVKIDKRETCRDLKFAIAAQTRVSARRQKLLCGTDLLPDSKRLEELTSEASVEVLLVSSPVCDLVTYSRLAPAVWDCDACTLEHPVIEKDDDLQLQDVEDAMRLEDGELYTLLKSRNYGAGLLCIQLWRGIPGSCVHRFPLSPRWLDTYVSVFFSPDGAFVIADCADYETVRMWHTSTGEPHSCFLSGPDDNTGTILDMQSMCRLALVVKSGTIELWNYHDGTRCHRWENFETFFYFHFARLSISGSWIAYWCDDRELTVWEREHRDDAMTFSRVDRAAFSSDEKEIVAMHKHDGQVAVIRLCDGQTRTVVVPACRWLFSDIGFSVDASTIFLAESSGRLFRWSRESLELLPATPDPSKDVMKLGLCRDGNTFFRSDRDGRIELIDLIQGAFRVLEGQQGSLY